MVKGSEDGLLLLGGSMRRYGEESRRLAFRRPTRLCFGEPRLWLMGVVFVVVGTETERALGFGLGLSVVPVVCPKRSNGEYLGVAVSVIVEDL